MRRDTNYGTDRTYHWTACVTKPERPNLHLKWHRKTRANRVNNNYLSISRGTQRSVYAEYAISANAFVCVWTLNMCLRLVTSPLSLLSSPLLSSPLRAQYYALSSIRPSVIVVVSLDLIVSMPCAMCTASFTIHWIALSEALFSVRQYFQIVHLILSNAQLYE